jgi:quercetin dioxygenase-like cupin family protein
MPFFNLDELETDHITPEYSSAVGPNIHGDKIEVGRFYYPKGTEAKAHAHPNEQIQVVIRGSGRFHTGGEEKILGPGDVIFNPPNVEHGIIEAIEDLEVINCKDVVPGWSVKWARWEPEEEE